MDGVNIGKNPFTGTGIYYPQCTKSELYAYHGVSSRIDPEDYNPRLIASPQEMVASERAFREIWKAGCVYSIRERERRGDIVSSSLFQVADRLAGDDKYVFLNLCEPHSAGSKGYHLVFDPYQLVDEGALVGLDDLQGLYISITEKLGVENRMYVSGWRPWQKDEFEEVAEDVQSVWRIRGREAWIWLEWVQGLRDRSPVNSSALRWTSRMVGARMEYVIGRIASSRKWAADRCELLMPCRLCFDSLVGVVFRKNYYEIEDFVYAYGPPGGEPPPVMSIEQAIIVDGSSGHPMRCPVCIDWMGLPPLEIRGYGAWNPVFPGRVNVPGIEHPVYVMVCQSCGAAILRESWGQLGGVEKYVGQYDDMDLAY